MAEAAIVLESVGSLWADIFADMVRSLASRLMADEEDFAVVITLAPGGLVVAGRVCLVADTHLVMSRGQRVELADVTRIEVR